MHRRPLSSRGWTAILLVSFLLFTTPVLNPAAAQEAVPGIPPSAAAHEQIVLEAVPHSDQAGFQASYFIYLPIATTSRLASQVNTQSRSEVLSYYVENYSAPTEISIDWTGSQGSCDPGVTSPSFRAAVLRRINYFRAMAGVPAEVTFSEESNRKAQAAALIMSSNGKLSHSPPSTWTCYSADGAAGAGSSNLFLGLYGWNAITGYMRDPGAGNTAVGHRRWILYPATLTMGTGDIPDGNGYSGSNSLVVFDSQMGRERPKTRDGFVAWPPPGYVPYPVVFPRWSFSYPKADFSGSTVNMSLGGTTVSVVQYPVVNGYGENTLAWIPAGMSEWQSWPQPGGDELYSVSIQNVLVGSQRMDFTYEVTIFNPTS